MAILTSCQLESYPSVTEWISAQDKIINCVAVCDITTEDFSRKMYIMSILPIRDELRTFPSTLEVSETADTVANIVTHLLSFEARLGRPRGLSPHAALFVTKKGVGRRSKDKKSDDWMNHVVCHGCGIKGPIKAKCRRKHKWASYKKSTCDANLASTSSTSTAESDSFLFAVINADPDLVSTSTSVITLNVVFVNRSADYCILDTGPANHVTSNCHLFQTFYPMTLGHHQIQTANNSYVDAETSGTIMLYVDRTNAKPVKIDQQHVLFVPAYGPDTFLSIIHLIPKGVNFDFNLNGAMLSLGSVLVYDAALINCLCLLKASAALAFIPKASLAVDDPPSSEICEAYSNIRPAVDGKDIHVWPARHAHLSSPGINRLPDIVKGI
jgi:hypothetical protein